MPNVTNDERFAFGKWFAPDRCHLFPVSLDGG